jgi:two-component system, OmpR family, sensor histidine kinase KdpD
MAIQAPPGRAVTALPRGSGGLPRRRRVGGLVLVLAGMPALTWMLVALRPVLARESTLLLYLLAVVVVAVVGGLVPALLAAGLAFLCANWFLTPPYNTLTVRDRSSLVDLVVLVVAAVTVSVAVDLGARHQARAERTRVEARLISRLSSDTSSGSVRQVLEQVRGLFGMSAVALVSPGVETPLAATGDLPRGEPVLRVPAGQGMELTAYGPELFAEDRRLLVELAETAGRAWERQRLAREAERAAQLAETDRVRSALLAAVSHDLRTPLAGIKAAASGLRDESVAWSAAEEQELLGAIEDGADRLSALVENLLAMSRIQAGAVSVQLGPVALDEVVSRALLGPPGREVEVAVAEDLPRVRADGALLERVVANLVDNARRFSPAGVPVEVYAVQQGNAVQLAVRDHGRGVPPEDWEEMFVPFQRLGDTSREGVGLGLAISRGLCSAMSAGLAPSATPGGGLTMTVRLPVEVS